MDADTFIKRWGASSRNETAASKPHFLDLCSLLELPPPTDDPTGSTYAFEKAVAKANGRKGWADVWRRDCFGWEYKSKGRDLDAAHDQLLRYAGALGNPPLLVTSDMARIVVKTNFTNTVTAAAEFDLEALRDGSTRDRLRDCWLAPDRWKPGTTRQALTERAAGDFALLAERLRKRGHAPETVAHFVNRLVFCLFANDVRLLPAGMLGELLAIAQQEPAGFADAAGMLFRAMKDPGGRIGFRPVPWFNGGLFDDDTALPLIADDIALLNKAAANDWSQVDPSIFGTLFERGLDPGKRSQLGAHYTDRAKIELLVGAVVTRPLSAEWETVRAEIAAKMDERAAVLKAAPAATEAALLLAGADAITAETQMARKDMRRAGERRTRKAASLLAEADGLYRSFLARMRAFRVLDPACGSGNFLYVSMLDLKDLELRVSVDAEAMGLEPSFPAIGPEAVLGIEINPFAAELARVSVWIGHIQWARRHGYPLPSNPVLRKLDTIECRDALLGVGGEEAQWPEADAIVGNPPFLGDRKIGPVLGRDYADKLHDAYDGCVPGGADLVCYWFEKARACVVKTRAQRAGLVSTNSIRGGLNRIVLDNIGSSANIYNAWSNEPWVIEGAAVRVSLICFSRKNVAASRELNGLPVTNINPDLTEGVDDMTAAAKLAANKGRAFQGTISYGPFEITGDEARALLILPTNPNSRPNVDVVRPWTNGIDIARRSQDQWIVFFPDALTMKEAALYEAPFELVKQRVKPYRAGKDNLDLNRHWWRLWRSRPDLSAAMVPMARQIVTPRVAKYRLFVWRPKEVIADSATVVIARDDDTAFGILHSRFHEVWALRMGTFLEDRPRYTPGTTFETFAFPSGLTLDIPAQSYAGNPRAELIANSARILDDLRRAWLDPSELVKRSPEVVTGLPERVFPIDAASAIELKKRTLTNLYNQRPTWLADAHRVLDEAVAAAYGWPADLSDDEVLARLLALNRERARI